MKKFPVLFIISLAVASVWAQRAVPTTTAPTAGGVAPTPAIPATPPIRTSPGVPTTPATPLTPSAPEANAPNPNQRLGGMVATNVTGANSLLPNQFGANPAPLTNSSFGFNPTNGFGFNGSNGFGFSATNGFGFGTNVTVADLGGMLMNLQVSIQQSLPGLLALAGQRTASEGARAEVRPRELASGEVVSSLGTNMLEMSPLTFRQLKILAGELQEALPLLQALNGAGVPTGANGNGSFVFGGFTNRFVLMTTNTAGQQILVPTGR